MTMSQITCGFAVAGHKQAYRNIDFKRPQVRLAAKVERIAYEPNRTGFHIGIESSTRTAISPTYSRPQLLAQGDTVRFERARRREAWHAAVGNVPIVNYRAQFEIKIGKRRANRAHRR